MHDGGLKVAVTAAPEAGKANKAIGGVLAKALGVSRSQVRLVRGMTSRQKRFVIVGLTPEAVRARLAEWTQS